MTGESNTESRKMGSYSYEKDSTAKKLGKGYSGNVTGPYAKRFM